MEGAKSGEPIVVGTDGSDTAKRAVGEALRLARALGCEVHVVSAFAPMRGVQIGGAPEAAAKIWAPLPDSAVRDLLDGAAAEAKLAGVEVQTHARESDPADALLEVANEVGASLIVVGSKGMHGARRFVLGSVPNKVSHHASCSVMIVSTEAP